MGYEIAQDLQWELPDVIVYPPGRHRPHRHLESIRGNGSARLDRIETAAHGGRAADRVSTDREGLRARSTRSELHQNAHTIAAGLRVPKPLGDRMMLRAIRASGGTAIAVSDDDIVQMTEMTLRVEGISLAFEGAATLVAARELRDRGWLKPQEKIVCLNTGAGRKCPRVSART